MTRPYETYVQTSLLYYRTEYSYMYMNRTEYLTLTTEIQKFQIKFFSEDVD